MKIHTRFLLILIQALFILFITGCIKQEVSKVNRKRNFEVIVKMRNSDFWQTVKLGAEVAGKEFDINVKFNAPENEQDIDIQIKLVSDAIERKADAIILAACDYKKLVNIAEKAIDSGIPVIIIDSALDSTRISSFIATNNIEAGRKIGNKLIELIGKKANVAIISFIKGAATSDQREEGFMQAIKNFPDIKLVTKEYRYSNTKLASELTKKVLTEYNDIDAVIGLNSYSTIGAANTVKEMNLEEKVKVLGFDSTPEEVDLIEDGLIQAVIVQNPYSMGYLGIKHALDAINKKTIPKYIDTGSKIIEKTNIYTPENQRLLFPFIK